MCPGGCGVWELDWGNLLPRESGQRVYWGHAHSLYIKANEKCFCPTQNTDSRGGMVPEIGLGISNTLAHCFPQGLHYYPNNDNFAQNPILRQIHWAKDGPAHLALIRTMTSLFLTQSIKTHQKSCIVQGWKDSLI